MIFLFIFLCVLAFIFIADGFANILSVSYFEKRQKLLKIGVKAPEGIDAQKYYLINRLLAGLSTIGAGAVVIIWMIEAHFI